MSQNVSICTFEQFWANLSWSGRNKIWLILSNLEQFRAISSNFEQFWADLGATNWVNQFIYYLKTSTIWTPTIWTRFGKLMKLILSNLLFHKRHWPSFFFTASNSVFNPHMNFVDSSVRTSSLFSSCLLAQDHAAQSSQTSCSAMATHNVIHSAARNSQWLQTSQIQQQNYLSNPWFNLQVASVSLRVDKVNQDKV